MTGNVAWQQKLGRCWQTNPSTTHQSIHPISYYRSSLTQGCHSVALMHTPSIRKARCTCADQTRVSSGNDKWWNRPPRHNTYGCRTCGTCSHLLHPRVTRPHTDSYIGRHKEELNSQSSPPQQRQACRACTRPLEGKCACAAPGHTPQPQPPGVSFLFPPLEELPPSAP